MRRALFLLCLFLVACGGAAPITLRRVVLHPSGVAYFEREGRVGAEGLRLRVMPHEVDDVLTTLTVVDRGGSRSVPSVVVPRTIGEGPQELSIEVGEARDVLIAYAAPAAAWRPSYRVVLPDERGAEDVLLQAWAVVDNTSAEEWRNVELTLATDAPLSFAVDLRTPRLVQRPIVAGHAPAPIALGPVGSERSTRFDDADAVPYERDRCPDEPEDTDGFQDEDGCPEGDNDADGIVDVDDRCPDDVEAFNGTDDDDGCPDRGLVVVEAQEIRIHQPIMFADGSAELGAASAPLLEAIAAALRGNPELARVEVRGHAHPGEDDAWALSAERAGAVRAALIERGIGGGRLIAIALGDTRPLGSADSNRRVDFQIVSAEQAIAEDRETGVRAQPLARTFAGAPLPRSTGAGTRFVVGRRVTVPAGSSAMVAILSQRVAGEDVLLFRPDPNVPLSAAHPLRAARVVNATELDLAPGPVTLFRGGELAGQGLLDALHAGEHAFVPYAVDEATTVAFEDEHDSLPSRVLSFREGIVTLERIDVRRRRYHIEAGRRVPARIFVRHARNIGYAPHELPPGTEASPSALLVPVPIDGAADARLAVEERRPLTGDVRLLEDLGVDLRPYALPEDLSDEARARLERILDDRDAAARARGEAARLQQRIAESGVLTAELRRDVRALDAANPVRRRLAQRLDEAAQRTEALALELATLRAAESEAMDRLREAIAELVF